MLRVALGSPWHHSPLSTTPRAPWLSSRCMIAGTEKALSAHKKDTPKLYATTSCGTKPGGILQTAGAGDAIRTRDNLLGRQELCQLSYSRSKSNGGVRLPPFLALKCGWTYYQ